VLVPSPGATTNIFEGHNLDMNGDPITSNFPMGGVLLDLQSTLTPSTPLSP
jgi:hypothetical protein